MKIEMKQKKKKVIVATTIMLLISVLNEKKTINRSAWIDDWLLKFGTESHGLWYENVFDEWSTSNKDRFKRTLRLSPAAFEQLLALVRPSIEKQNTHMRKAVPANKRLAVTLKFLATGESFYSLSGQFCLGASTVADIVKTTLPAIVSALRDVMNVPNNNDDWKSIADGFYSRWDYPNCVGALDGKHILIQCPPKSGSDFYNYQGTFSTVLLALVDSHYRFTYVDVGAEGRVGDAGVWNRSDFKNDVISNRIGFPDAECVPRSEDDIPVPYHIVGDSAFQLAKFMMKPYSQAAINNDIDKRIFNYRLSRARRCVENAFGILTHRFEIFSAPIRTTVETADQIVLACIALHNWLMTDRMLRESYCPPGLVDEEDILNGVVTPGSFRNDPPSKGFINIASHGSNRSSNSAQDILFLRTVSKVPTLTFLEKKPRKIFTRNSINLLLK